MNAENTWFLILTFKYPDGLGRLLVSLRETNFPMSMVKVILNGVNMDEYKEVLSEFKRDLLDKNILSWPHNMGCYRAYNNGIMSIPPTDYFVLCNDDVVIKDERWMEAFYSEMNELVGVVGIKQRHTLGAREIVDNRRIMSCCLLNPVAVRKVGLFDERYNYWWGDIQYWCRIHASGFRIKSIETPYIEHEISHTFDLLHAAREPWALWDAYCFNSYYQAQNPEWCENLDLPVRDIATEVKQFLTHKIKWSLPQQI